MRTIGVAERADVPAEEFERGSEDCREVEGIG